MPREGRGLRPNSGQKLGHNKDTITVPRCAFSGLLEPSIARRFYKLRVSGSLSRQRSRVRAPSSPRHTFQNTYGTYGLTVTIKSGSDKDPISPLLPNWSVFFFCLLTHVLHDHPYNLALCSSHVRVHSLCLNTQRDSVIRLFACRRSS